MLPELDEIVEGLPPLSPASARLIQLCNDLSAPHRELVDVIRLDPVLTAKILKVINSAYYGMPSTVTRVDRALVLLGFNTVKNIALASAVLEKLRPRDDSSVDLDAMWLDALAVGIAAKQLAASQGVGRSKIEDYFTAGLLSDLGAIVLARASGDDYLHVIADAQATGRPVRAVERERFGFDRTDVGERIVKEWNLPAPINAVVSAACDGEHLHIVDVVHVASVETNARRSPDLVRVRDPECYARLGIDPDDADELFNELDSALDAAQGLVRSAA